MPRPPAERTPASETVAENVAVLEAELAAAGQDFLADPVAKRARDAIGRSEDPRVIVAVERQSAAAQRVCS